jgi:hypothetical protein
MLKLHWLALSKLAGLVEVDLSLNSVRFGVRCLPQRRGNYDRQFQRPAAFLCAAASP